MSDGIGNPRMSGIERLGGSIDLIQAAHANNRFHHFADDLGTRRGRGTRGAPLVNLGEGVRLEANADERPRPCGPGAPASFRVITN